MRTVCVRARARLCVFRVYVCGFSSCVVFPCAKCDCKRNGRIARALVRYSRDGNYERSQDLLLRSFIVNSGCDTGGARAGASTGGGSTRGGRGGSGGGRVRCQETVHALAQRFHTVLLQSIQLPTARMKRRRAHTTYV